VITGSEAPLLAAAKVDTYEKWATVVFTLQFPTVCRVGLHTLMLGSYSNQHMSLAVSIPILVFEAMYASKLFRDMRILHGRPLRCLGGCRTPLPKGRLRVRLQYLTCKYADHASSWQFVLWARQLAIIAIITAFQPYDDAPMVLSEGAAALSILCASLVLHCRTRPYVHRYQNYTEVALASCSIIAVLVSCIVYPHRPELSFAWSTAFEVSMVGLLLGPAVVVGAWIALRGKHVPKATSSTRQNQHLMHEVLLDEGSDGRRVLGGGGINTR
jgi:hypothetical protein